MPQDELQSLTPLPNNPKNIKETESSSSLISDSTDDSIFVFNHLFEKLRKLCDELHPDTRKIQGTANSTNDRSSTTHYLWTPGHLGGQTNFVANRHFHLKYRQ